MSGRYTKIKSNYVLRTPHQMTDLGQIMERDWVTTNGPSVLRFGEGRRIYYNSGNFIFTISNVPTFHKRHRLDTEVETWDWNKCKDADGTVNAVRPAYRSNDMRKYAYYGSCAEMVRATIDEIIMDFPGRIVNTGDDAATMYGVPEITGKLLNNEFNIDLHHVSVNLGEYDNPMRFMCESYMKYAVNGNKVTSFTVSKGNFDPKCPKNGQLVAIITLNSYKVKAFYLEGTVIYTAGDDVKVIQPQQKYIDEYFAGLKGFKAQLLRQDTKPLYKNEFRTPREINFRWYYNEEYYIWPSNDYCIDINSTVFVDFYNKLVTSAMVFDELWCDNVYRSMTHEAIKNFDWTYSREYKEGDEQDNIDGGERMKKILRLFGAAMDEIKYYIDTIQLINTITYNGENNVPDALLSDNVAMKGMDVTSTIGEDYDVNTTIDETKLGKWYKTRRSEDFYPDVCDNEFMRRMSLSIKRIMQSKGTQHGIEMMLGMFGFGLDNEEFKIEEVAYDSDMKKFDECYNPKGSFDWASVNSRTYGELAAEVNQGKTNEKLYTNDVYSGVPLKKVTLGATDYLVPYYDINKLYDGNLVFQSKGGWGSKGDNKHIETLSYLDVVSSVTELISMSTSTISINDIFYVTNLTDYTAYDETASFDNNAIPSHYFVYTKNGWKPLWIKPQEKLEKIDASAFNAVEKGWEYSDYESSFAKMVYLESIVSTDFGNNPHVGYGKYDDGEEFLEYMKKPFKYAVDTSLFDNFSYKTFAEDLTFGITKIGDKVQITPKGTDKWYINSKVITITNKHGNSELFKKYLNNVILPYLMQVIPSTTILKLKGF